MNKRKIVICLIVLSVLLIPIPFASAEDETVMKTYSDNGYEISYSEELPFFVARDSAFFGLLSDDPHYFQFLEEVKAKIDNGDESINETKVFSISEEEYSDIDYDFIKDIKSVEIQLGAEEDLYFCILTYKFAHTKLVITFYEGGILESGYLEIYFEYTGYFSNNYEVGGSYMIDGEYKEFLVDEGNNRTIEIEV
jgi:hypothetical protein